MAGIQLVVGEDLDSASGATLSFPFLYSMMKSNFCSLVFVVLQFDC